MALFHAKTTSSDLQPDPEFLLLHDFHAVNLERSVFGKARRDLVEF
jgi:hypothetical protein